MTNTIATSAINVMALAILSRMVHSNHILAGQRKKPFVIGIALTVVVMLAETATIVASDGGSAWRSLNVFGNVLGFALTPFIPVVLLAIFDTKVLQARPYLLLPALLNGIAAVLSPVFGLLFTVDADNRYARGSLFFIFVAVYLLHLLFLLVFTLRNDQRHIDSIHWNMFGLTVFVVAGTFIQLVFPLVYTSWHSVTLSLFLYYLLLSDFDGRFDPLTGLYNRSAFEKDISLLSKRKRYTVIVMDLNDFKRINDTFGHEYGDAVLQKVAAIIQASFDRDCSSYRIGGDEFYVLCRNADPEMVEHQLKSMTNRLAGARKLDSSLPTVAYGHSTSETDAPDIQIMLKAADAEMYRYKQLQKLREVAGDDDSTQENANKAVALMSSI